MKSASYPFIFIVLVTGLPTGLTPVALAKELPHVGVLDLGVVDGAVTKSEAQFLTDQIRGASVKVLGKQIVVITRENLVDLLKAHGKTMEQCSEAKCATEYGRAISADYIITGEILKYGRQVKATLRLHRTSPPQLLESVQWGGEGVQELEKGLGKNTGILLAVLAAGSDATQGQRTGVLFLRVDTNYVKYEIDAGLHRGTLLRGKIIQVHLPLRKHPYQVLLKRKGFYHYDAEVLLSGRRRAHTIDHQMIKMVQVRPTGGTGVLDLRSNPSNAAILIDGKLRTERTPTSLEIPAGNHLVQIRRKAYRPWTGEVSIETAGIVRRNAVLEPNFGKLSLQVSPKIAEIFLNGKRISRGTYSSARQIAGGYSLRVEAANHHPFIGTIFVERKRSIKKSIVLKPAYGSVLLKIHTQVDDGSHSSPKLFLEGSPRKVIFSTKIKGRGKLYEALLRKVPSGNYEIEIQLQRFRPWSGTMHVEDGVQTKMNMNLDSQFGTLLIRSTPKKAKVQIDGRDVGETPLSYYSSIGTQKIKILPPSNHYRGYSTEAAVIKDRITKISAILEKRIGGLTIATQPPDAEISIDGKTVGRSPAQIKNLLVGKRTIELHREGFTPKKQTVVVREGEMRVVRIEMTHLGAIDVICKSTIESKTSLSMELDEKSYETARKRFEGLAAGKHKVRCISEDGRRVEKEISAVPGTIARAVLDVDAPEVLLRSWKKKYSNHIWSTISLSIVAGALGLAGGLTLWQADVHHSAAEDAYQDYLNATDNQTANTAKEEVDGLQEQRAVLEKVGWPLVGVSIGAAITAAIVFLTRPSKPSSTEDYSISSMSKFPISIAPHTKGGFLGVRTSF